MHIAQEVSDKSELLPVSESVLVPICNTLTHLESWSMH